MKCANCGANLAEGAKICKKCNAPVIEGLSSAPASPAAVSKSNWGMILGFAGLSTAWFGFFSIAGIVSIIISTIGLIINGKARKADPKDKSSKSGWTLSLFGLIASLVLSTLSTIYLFNKF